VHKKNTKSAGKRISYNIKENSFLNLKNGHRFHSRKEGKFMKKKTLGLTAILMAVTMLAGCGQQTAQTSNETSKSDSQKTSSEQSSETGKSDEVSAEPVEVVVWHDNDETMMGSIAEVVNQKLADDKITLKFEKKSDLTSQIQLYGTDAVNGPDMYLFAHDSLGGFAEMGILEPVGNLISADKEADLLPMTIQADTYKGEQYLMPLYFETLLMIYNKDLWEGDIPDTTEELYDYMVAHTDGDNYALVNQHSGAYNVSPFIYGFGGYIINEDAPPGQNEPATKEAIDYNKKFAALEADGDYNTVTALFNEGKAAAIWGGPWLISGIKEAGINYGVKSLADIKLPNGNALKPFSGVQSLGVFKYAAENKGAAITKVLEVLAQPEVGIVLAKEYNCAPANVKAYDDPEVAQNEMIVAMQKTAETAVPMPNIPQMGSMWGPTESLLAAVNKSGQNVEEVADNYQKEALAAIADMQ